MEDNLQDLSQVNRDFLNVSELYFYAFGDGPGAKVLAHLQSTLEGSNLNANSVCDFQAEITPEQLMFLREGQNQVLRHIKAMMEYYRTNRNS